MMDEKGRLFGKINLVDLLIIVVVIIVAAVVGVKFLGGGESAINPSKTHITYTVLVESVQPAVYENIQAVLEEGPSTLMASGELLDGQVTAVTAVPHEESVTVSTTANAVVLPVGRGLLDLTFTIEANVVNPITTELGTQEVRIGKTHIVKTDTFELVNGTIMSCVWGEQSQG